MRMATGSESDEAAPEYPVGKPRQLCRARQACIRTEIGVGVYIEHLKYAILQPQINAPVIAASQG